MTGASYQSKEFTNNRHHDANTDTESKGMDGRQIR